MNGGPKVILLSPDAREVDRWSALLEGAADVRAVASVEALARALALLAPLARELFSQTRRSAP